MANNRYKPELKDKILRLYLDTKKRLPEEFNLSGRRY